MSQSENKLRSVTSITSNGDRLDPAAHQVDLAAVASHPISLGEIAQGLTSQQKFIILKRIGYDGLTSLEDLPVNATVMMEKIENLSDDEAVEILKEALVEHEGDPNFPYEVEVLIETLLEAKDPHSPKTGTLTNLDSTLDKSGNEITEEKISDSSSLEANDVNFDTVFDWSLQVRTEAALIAYWSPYPEVRSVSDCFDDPSMACETPRVYLLGLIWMAIGTFLNQFFSQRQPGISLSTPVVQLFLLPCGTFLAAVLPKWKFKVWKYTFDLNPGPWTYKEQLLSTIMFSVSGPSYVASNILVQKMFYGNDWVDWGYQILLSLSNNFLGFGLAGIMRKFAVYPVRAMWPTMLPTLALNAALIKPEKKENINGWTISRYRYFMIVAGGSFLYFWLPDYLMQFLSQFNWLTWIKPDNITLAEITGSFGGLGVNPFPSFDWNIISYATPLYLPFYSQLSTYAGLLIGLFTICGVYYSNHLWTGYIPINSNRLFTNTGEPYNVEAVINKDSLFDEEMYKQVGPPFYSAANLVVYGAFFASYPFIFIYECAVNYKAMWAALKGLYKTARNYRRSTFEGFKDPHCQMMRQYKEVPEWAFLVVLVISIVLAIICVEVYPAQTPVWGIFFALGINVVFLFPNLAIYSSTGYAFGLNVLVELIVGYALPGNGLALIFIKAFGYNIDGQAQNYITDQKMGHYARIPPRALFRAQLLSVFVSTFICLATLNYQLESFKDYCSPTNKQKFTCPNASTYYSASVIWGVIGPKKVFGGLYPILQWVFLIGALLPIPCLLLRKYGPKHLIRFFQPTIIIGGMINYAPYNLSYFTGGLYLSILFMYYIKNHYLTWWEKYNYVTSGSLDAGVAFSSIIIFFAVQYHDKSINWWGNVFPFTTADEYVTQYGRLNATLSAPDGYFGPRKGHFP